MDTLRTKRLVLRRARIEDAVPLHAILRDPRAMACWSTLPHETQGQTEAWLAGMLDGDPASDDYVIEQGGQVIGKAGCWRVPEIGFILHPAVWRQGIGREALGALIPALVARHPVAALTADVDPRNRASLALLAGLGFRQTGRTERTYRLGDLWCDSIYLALPRP